MKIKKVLVSSIQEGMQIITKELGEDAVILSTRNIESDSDETDNKIEIIAAIDESFSKEGKENNLDNKNHLKNNNNGVKLPDFSSNETLIYSDGLKNQIIEIKQLLYDLSHRVKFKINNNQNDELKAIFKDLLNSEFSEDFAYKIIDELSDLVIDDSIREDKEGYQKYIKEKAKNLILKDIKILPPITKSDNCTIISFFGTTGGGKTTTLIKLAILFKIIFNADTVILSTDVNKVGAIEQLQTYSSIAAIPHYAIFSPEDLAIAIEENKSKDFILIDTTGSSQQDKELINELKGILDIVGEHHRFLVQSCNVGKATFRQIIKEYSVLNPSGIILTKLDEAAALGNIIEVLNTEKLPLTYFTNGTRVPDDIEPANLDYLKQFTLL
jgi:flagellar biosynthesis protein FlhF